MYDNFSLQISKNSNCKGLQQRINDISKCGYSQKNVNDQIKAIADIIYLANGQYVLCSKLEAIKYM